MANDEQVALLKQGVAAWNTWRGENPNVVPELSGANLYGAYLRGANLTGANLSDADLWAATLVDTILRALISPAVASMAYQPGA
jgi:uncharacterized protein YjbI with pentapeptide repeats